MLTRLRVTGFKNLLDVEVRFGPFTCIAGANGVGKSNLFDAILFLSRLAELPLVEAASQVRDDSAKQGDAIGLFHRHQGGHATEMSFEADMIIPAHGIDDLGQDAKAAITFVTYKVVLGYRENGAGPLELKSESLDLIPQADASQKVGFPCLPAWLKSAVVGQRRAPLIRTTDSQSGCAVILHVEHPQGKQLNRLASTLPRTVLSSVNTAENPTALLVKREMRSWRQLQLEPTAMRRADSFRDPSRVSSIGAHLPATLHRLARLTETQTQLPDALSESQVYGHVANRLSQLIDGVRSVRIDRDEKRELLTICLKDREGREFPARDLSDGTLRFLALSILELDTATPGIICFEEPENGIHPDRIPAMLQLLQDMTTDTSLPIGTDNPLRQVIINTHSPAVVQQVDPNALVVAESIDCIEQGHRTQAVSFGCIKTSDGWRATTTPPPREVSLGRLLSYLSLSPDTKVDDSESEPEGVSPPREPVRVIDLMRRERKWGQRSLFGDLE